MQNFLRIGMDTKQSNREQADLNLQLGDDIQIQYSKVEVAKGEAAQWSARVEELLERRRRVLSRFSVPVLTRMLDDQARRMDEEADRIVQV